jgi:hypothetical protein
MVVFASSKLIIKKSGFASFDKKYQLVIQTTYLNKTFSQILNIMRKSEPIMPLVTFK